MRFFFIILTIPTLLLCSCSEPKQVESSTPARSPDSWSVQNVTPVDTRKLLAENKDVRVLDVRTPAEYAQGHIAGAVNVDFNAADFADQVAQLDKNTSYIVHCRSGKRSSNSLPILKEQGFTAIYHLNKGFNAWKDAGMLTAP
ncbi:MAG: rhodanese-like domain-containing protein [Akkermansiaceae bacterium]|nr:rhodanese-like domain-containing protein [Akkermansiaceae bacterium]